MKKQKVSRAVIRRLPRYYRHLDRLHRGGVERISSGSLGESMGLTASQIRQDLSCFGEFGQQGYGYNVESLLHEIGEILGMDKGYKVVILGVGNLGRGLTENFRFKQNGFTLEAVFDVVPETIGATVGGLVVRSSETLEEYLAGHDIDVGVLTVPGIVAQEAADRLVASGIRAIWNFTNEEIRVPENVVVESVHFADSLLTLSYMLTEE